MIDLYFYTSFWIGWEAYGGQVLTSTPPLAFFRRRNTLGHLIIERLTLLEVQMKIVTHINHGSRVPPLLHKAAARLMRLEPLREQKKVRC